MKDLYEKIHAIIEGIETPEDRAHAKDAIDALIAKRLEYIAETHAHPVPGTCKRFNCKHRTTPECVCILTGERFDTSERNEE